MEIYTATIPDRPSWEASFDAIVEAYEKQQPLRVLATRERLELPFDLEVTRVTRARQGGGETVRFSGVVTPQCAPYVADLHDASQGEVRDSYLSVEIDFNRQPRAAAP